MAIETVRFNLSDLSEVDGLLPDFVNNNSVTFIAGKNGDAASFDDALSQNLDTTDSFYHNLTDISFHMVGWINIDNLGQNHGLFGQSVNSYHCHVISSNKVRFRVSSGGNKSIDSTVTIVAGTWYHISCGFDFVADETFLSIDRASNQVLDLLGVSILSDTSKFHLGSISGGNYADARIDGFMFRKDGLFSTMELDDHWNGGAGTEFVAMGRSNSPGGRRDSDLSMGLKI